MRIITIANIEFEVSELDYEYFSKVSLFNNEDSDEYKIACRRMLGLGPDDHVLNLNFIRYHLWGKFSDDVISKIKRSGLVEYIEPILIHKVSNNTAKSAIEAEIRLNASDPEFEPELNL